MHDSRLGGCRLFWLKVGLHQVFFMGRIVERMTSLVGVWLVVVTNAEM